ncbi:hypothetical protein TSUD_300090 [Trifolium subterraneum]|uniref:GH18 domain-containing protein n=1 Tax=Trifolium subterraneum TaxID=3900 RepID=A0A2Z6PFS7_TRISU|nr:hypothetical protein TSUD_300090 [Trifolium subterraneum]
MSHSHLINAVVNPIIFREYIGVKDLPASLVDFPVEIINDSIQQFHFILGFGREDYENGKGSGNFHRTWNIDRFSPAKVAKLKKEHKNVKVIISIGGQGNKYPFDPKDALDLWVTKAEDSIKELIQDYEKYLKEFSDSANCPCPCDNIIDGIDINYEYVNTDKETFSTYIGSLIQKLKKDCNLSKFMNVVSIAPNVHVETQYRQLYLDYKNHIDWIDYKFYDQALPNADEFVTLYSNLVIAYGTRAKLLAGVSTDPEIPNTKINRDAFVAGCKSLIGEKSLPGIFVWNANNSASPNIIDPNPYLLERVLQNLYAAE